MSMAKACRACLEESEPFFDMDKPCYLSEDKLTLSEIFEFCTQLKIRQDEIEPQRICNICFKDLQTSYSFLQKVLQSDERLKQIIRDQTCNRSKDPLENISDDDEEDKSDQHTFEGSAKHDVDCLENMAANGDNNDNKIEDSSNALGQQLTSSASDSYKDDNDFLASLELQIFPQGRFKCKLCDKASYFTNVGLQAHMEIHAPKIKNKPKQTTKSTAASRRLKKINKVQTEASDEDVPKLEDKQANKQINKNIQPKPKKMFPCQVCGKQMISASKLRYHMVMHTGEKDYLCTMCPKAYSTIYALKHHMRAHTGERPYECTFCGDCFLRPTTLKSHMRRHTGERPYACNICDKRFIQHSSMATHMKLNHMDKTIACTYCDKKYARQTDLNTHLLSHSGEKPFSCVHCPSRFTRQSNLNKHMNQQHQFGETSGVGQNRSTIKFKNLIQNQNFNENHLLTSVKRNTFADETSEKSSFLNSPLITETFSTHPDFNEFLSARNWS